MKVSTMETTVASGMSRATQLSRSCEGCDFGDNNTYNRDSYLDEADMNS
jgi:hypothetical protein